MLAESRRESSNAYSINPIRNIISGQEESQSGDHLGMPDIQMDRNKNRSMMSASVANYFKEKTGGALSISSMRPPNPGPPKRTASIESSL